jgi:hypothetical protein
MFDEQNLPKPSLADDLDNVKLIHHMNLEKKKINGRINFDSYDYSRVFFAGVEILLCFSESPIPQFYRQHKPFPIQIPLFCECVIRSAL